MSSWNLFKKDWSTIWYNIRKGNFFPFFTKIPKKLYQLWFTIKGHDGVKVVEKDWDYLIILDACRYDIFEETNWIDGQLEKVVSKGASTPEWLKENFDRYFDDIVYVSANPFVARKEWFESQEAENISHDFNQHIKSYEGDFHEIYATYLREDAIEKGTLKPESVAEDALKADEKHPDKRMIIHFMQPHFPCIGEPSMTVAEGDVRGGDEFHLHKDGFKAYKANLERVLPEVERIIEKLEGKIVVSADHGEAFREKGIIGHHGGVYIKELVEVPWFEIKKQKEKEISGIDV